MTSVGWLAQQPAAFQERLLAASELRTIAAREVIYAIDDPPGGLYGVADGYINVLIASGPFPPRLVHIGGPGWWVGEAAVASLTPRRAELNARTRLEILYVSAIALDQIAADEPAFWRRLATLTVQHLDLALELMICRASTDLGLRLATTLNRLANPRMKHERVVELPINQEELGEIAGLSRNTVGRELTVLLKSGCIEKRYGRIAVHRARLAAWIRRAH